MQLIDLEVTCPNCFGLVLIIFHEDGEGILDHFPGNFSHSGNSMEVGYGRLAGAPGNCLGFIANTFDLVADLDDGYKQAQVRGHRGVGG